MLSRKLILFGKNSFVISLPKNWIERNDLKKGDAINIEETFDMLMLSTNVNHFENEIKIKKIICGDNEKDISRRLISAYVNNYDIIEIKGNNLIPYFDLVSSAISKILALEIMELGPKKIIIKDFLNTSDISLENIMKRIDMIIRSMITELIESVLNKDPINLDLRDKDINRMFYVANKLINKVLEKPKLANELNIQIKDILLKWRVLVSFEVIGDQIKRIIRLFNNLDKNEEKKNILTIFKRIGDEYIKIVKALYKFDKVLAEEVLDNKKNIILDCENILELSYLDCKNPKHLISIAFMVEKLKKFENNVCNIAKALMTVD